MASSSDEACLRRCPAHGDVLCKRVKEPPGYYCYRCARQEFQREEPVSAPSPEVDPMILKTVASKNVRWFNKSLQNSRARSNSTRTTISVGSFFGGILRRRSEHKGSVYLCLSLALTSLKWKIVHLPCPYERLTWWLGKRQSTTSMSVIRVTRGARSPQWIGHSQPFVNDTAILSCIFSEFGRRSLALSSATCSYWFEFSKNNKVSA